jgi:UMF1 family MFS transporter
MNTADRKRAMWAFARYDWANSAYSTLSITVLVTYLKVLLPGKPGILVWGYGIGGTMLVSAVLSPVLGAMADLNHSKRRWLAGVTVVGSLASVAMFFATPDKPWLLVAAFVVASLSFELAQGFYNAFLPDVATEAEMGRVSAYSYALGYVGGGSALALALVIFMLGDKLGLPDANYFRPRACLALMGLWWGGFGLWSIAGLPKQTYRRDGRPLFAVTRHAFAEVGRTLSRIRQYRMLSLFLLAFLLFNDGVQTVISQAGTFAEELLGMQTQELVMIVLMIQFMAFPGAVAVGWIADRIGQKTTLLACLAVWIGLLASAFLVHTTGQFWVMAMFVAVVLGGTQSVSRTIMGQMTPPERSAEFFGFFNLSGKATSMLGPMLFSTILAFTGSPHLAIVSLLVFFVVGALLVMPLDIARGRREAGLNGDA